MTDMIEIINQRFKKIEKQQDHDKGRITYVNQLVIDLEKKLAERIEKLEKKHNVETHKTADNKNRIEELERLTSHLLSTQRLNDHKSLFPSEKRLTDILKEQLPNHEVEITFDPGIKDETAYMVIRCPRQTKYMSAKEAMRHFFAGYKVTRKDWGYDGEHNNSYIKLDDIESVHLDYDDFQANDWYILEYERQ